MFKAYQALMLLLAEATEKDTPPLKSSTSKPRIRSSVQAAAQILDQSSRAAEAREAGTPLGAGDPRADHDCHAADVCPLREWRWSVEAEAAQAGAHSWSASHSRGSSCLGRAAIASMWPLLLSSGKPGRRID